MVVLCRPGIRVSDDHMSAAFASNEMWSTILGTTGFVSGTNRWAIRIDRSVTAYIFIGVATKDADLCNFLGSDQHGWGFIGDKALYHQRQKVSLYGDKRFIQGDTIGVTLVRRSELPKLVRAMSQVFMSVCVLDRIWIEEHLVLLKMGSILELLSMKVCQANFSQLLHSTTGVRKCL